MCKSVRGNEQRVKWCPICFSSLYHQQDIFNFIKHHAVICGKCKKQQVVVNRIGDLDGIRIHMIYTYNAFMESLLFQYKEGNDIALKQIFFHDIVFDIHKVFKQFTIIFPPSSASKEKERGFSALPCMLERCKLKMVIPFEKIKDYKQSQQPFEHRKNIGKYIRVREEYMPKCKRVLVVDDVCTTGETMRYICHSLRKRNYYVEALVLSIHPLLLKELKKQTLKKGKFLLESQEQFWFTHNS